VESGFGEHAASHGRVHRHLIAANGAAGHERVVRAAKLCCCGIRNGGIPSTGLRSCWSVPAASAEVRIDFFARTHIPHLSRLSKTDPVQRLLNHEDGMPSSLIRAFAAMAVAALLTSATAGAASLRPPHFHPLTWQIGTYSYDGSGNSSPSAECPTHTCTTPPDAWCRRRPIRPTTPTRRASPMTRSGT